MEKPTIRKKYAHVQLEHKNSDGSIVHYTKAVVGVDELHNYKGWHIEGYYYKAEDSDCFTEDILEQYKDKYEFLRFMPPEQLAIIEQLLDQTNLYSYAEGMAVGAAEERFQQYRNQLSKESNA